MKKKNQTEAYKFKFNVCKSDIIKQRYTLNNTTTTQVNYYQISIIQQSQEDCMQMPTVS